MKNYYYISRNLFSYDLTLEDQKPSIREFDFLRRNLSIYNPDFEHKNYGLQLDNDLWEEIDSLYKHPCFEEKFLFENDPVCIEASMGVIKYLNLINSMLILLYLNTLKPKTLLHSSAEKIIIQNYIIEKCKGVEFK